MKFLEIVLNYTIMIQSYTKIRNFQFLNLKNRDLKLSQVIRNSRIQILLNFIIYT